MKNCNAAPEPPAIGVFPVSKEITPLMNGRLPCREVLWCEGWYRRNNNKATGVNRIPDSTVIEIGKRIGQGIGTALMFLAVLTALGWEGLFPAAGPKGRTLAERLSEN